jgi:anti-anti-sigma regulatory factor
MPIEVRNGDGEWSLVLSGTVDIFEVAALHAAARDAAATAETVVLHLEAVEAVDTSTTQVLLGLARALRERGRRCEVRDVPPAVAASWRRLGLADTLG